MKMSLSTEIKKSKQKGSISILLLMFVVGVAGFVVTQVPSLYDPLNALSASKKARVNDFAQIHQLILGVKSKRALFLLDSTCAGFANHTVVTSNGVGLCVDLTQGVCVDVDGTLKQCISLSAASLDWQKGKGVPKVIVGKAKASSVYEAEEGSEEGYKGGTVKNRQSTISIPATSDLQIWRKCTDAGAGCIKVSLCPQDDTDVNCDPTDVLSETVVRLGEL